MKKIFSLFVAFLLVFNLLSPYAALAESTVETSDPDNFEVPIDIEDDTYELDHVNACLSDMFDLDEIKEEDLEDFDLDQLELTEEDVLTLKDCLTLLLEEEKAANEEMATEEEEAVTEEEAIEDVVTEEEEDVVTEEEATEEEDVVTEEEATEEEDVVAEEEATEEEDVVAEEEATEEEDVVTEEEATEEEDVVTKEEATDEKEIVLEELEESPMMMFSMRVMEEPVKKSTSRLGHLYRSATVYKDLDQTSTLKLSDLLDTVYYIKQQATYQGETFYLISKEPSATKGTVGWVKSSDIRSYTHTTTHKNKSTYYVNGSGKAYTKASGGSRDEVYSNLSNQKGQEFHVHLTEKAGNDTWFRGTLNNKTVWIKSSDVSEKAVTGKKTSTSRLGHLYRSATVYKDLGSSGTLKLSNLLDTVYYIKQQATYNGDTYYLISTQPSSSKGTVGWVRSSDIRSFAHSTTNKNKTTLYVKGTGKAYTKAWGGSKDEVYSNLSNHKGKKLEVNLTEKVGNDTWYRGTLNNRTVFIKSSDLNDNKVSDKQSTSRLGHLYRSATVYKDLGNSSTLKLSDLLDTVYYIKQQAQYNGDTYYLISKNPSATKGTVGWVKSSDIRSYSHTTTDKKKHTFYVNGTGKSYTKAWGGSKDVVFNLSNQKDKEFVTNLTEKVGNDTWYRGTLNGKTAWIHVNDLSEKLDTKSSYNITLDQAANMQYGANAQTDRYSQYVHKDYVKKSGNTYTVNASLLNVRSGPGTNYPVVDQLANGKRLSIRGTSGSWYQLFWVDAKKQDIIYYLDPNNFINDKVQQFQFLDLAKTSGASETALNNYLRGKGILAGQGKAFIDAGRTHGINDVYLLSHALLETGNGSSTLAKGVKYNGVTVYNMYGIGAKDSCPIECGTKYAYDQGWTTPYKSIVGGAAFIGNSYVKSGQNSLYKMRWNPDAMVRNGRASHQYATDIGWASKQVHSMYNLYQGIGSYTLNLDIPVYK
ncbi:N-acetylglucosaminidase [Alkalicoccobacillus gibsonii]|uniref:N-acetylglucosaminidase n=1 Tax=Alkalicoccobacillus gibsonii TaxID=79881 RepID=UPI00193149F5|nr:N-acetylglucosaminidase [Alkalicoccobacillus gibsonii]MBM0065962.1 N-acetylglucosaminidase [Alkalicoccobacillus gibsonii]